jgi:protein transport protein SEC24
MGSDAVFKLRCSNGVQVKSYSPALPFGTLIGDGIVDSAELELSSIDSSTTIAVMLEHKIGGVVHTRDGGKKIDAPPMVFFQSAVLYTTMTGRRRVRVSTLGLSTSKVSADVFRSADLGTVATIMTREAVSDLNRSNEGSLLKSARDNVFKQCVSILANYRLHTNARTSPSGQLILPESLQLLPLFCLSLRKSRMFRHSLQSNAPSAKPFPTADERAYHIFYASTVSPNIALQSIHPNVFQISDMRTRDGDWITPQVLQANKFLDEDVIAASLRPVSQLPKSTNPSMTCLDECGIYILDDRFAFYLFVGKNVLEEKWRELIYVETSQFDSRGNCYGVPVGSLSLTTTDEGHKLRSILEQLRMMNAPNSTLALNIRPTHAPLILVFVGRGSVFEEEMDSLLIDDPDTHEKSYVDFLCTMHRAIRDITANAE